MEGFVFQKLIVVLFFIIRHELIVVFHEVSLLNVLLLQLLPLLHLRERHQEQLHVTVLKQLLWGWPFGWIFLEKTVYQQPHLLRVFIWNGGDRIARYPVC